MRSMRSIEDVKSIFSIAALVTGIFALVVIYLQHKLELHFFFNSDALYLPALYLDLFRDHGSLKDWFLTPAPYVVPDWPMYFLAARIFGQPYQAVAAFFVMQIVLAFVLLNAINKRLLDKKNALVAAAFSILFCCLIAAERVVPFSFMLVSAYHYGAFLMLLLSVFLVIRGIQERTLAGAGKYVFAVFLVTMLASLSDKLFVVQFSLPAIAALLYMSVKSMADRKTVIAFLLSISSGSVLGALLYTVVVPNALTTPAEFGLENLSANAHQLLTLAKHGLEGSVVAFAIIALFHLVAAGWFLFHLRMDKTQYKLGNEVLFIVVFSLCAAIGLVTVVLFNKMTLNGRYFIPLCFLPILFGPALAFKIFNETQAKMVSLSLLCGSAIVVFALGRMAMKDDQDIKADFYPPDIACIDEAISKHALRNGIAEYWDAKRVSVISKNTINIAQVFEDLSPHKWITTNAAFKDAYDFALINQNRQAPAQPNERRIIEINGKPKASVQCGSIKVLIYPQNGLITKDNPIAG